MKTKLLTLLAIVALPLVSTNCGKTETSGGTEPEPVPEENVSLSLSSGIASKTVLGELNGDAYPVYWCEGDRIAVNGKRSEPLHEIGARTVKATFEVNGVNAPYGVVYPSWICDAMDAEKAEITLQTIQKWTPGSFSNGAAVLYGQSSDKEFELKNLCGVVRIAMDFGKNKIAGIVLKSLSAPISGKFGLNLATGALSAIEGNNKIEISVPDAGFASGSSGAAELNFCVPAGEYPDGFNITLTDSYNRQMVIEIRENTRIPAGVVVDWGKQTFVPAGALIITDPESWNTFADAVNAGDYSDWVDPETGEVNVASNIVSAGDLTQIESWNGVFNGGGYTITRNAIHKPLFKKIAEGAVVKNLKLDGLRNEPGENSCAVLAGTNLGTIENCESKSKLTVTVDANFHFCGLVEANAGTMRSCTNSADFEINLPFTGNHELIGGGLAFRPDADSKLGTFEDCKNTGNITILKNAVAASGLHKCAVGGILASAYGGTKDVFVKLKNCSNGGKITLWENEKQKSGDQGAYAVGGIVGRIALLSGNADVMFVNPTPATGFYTEITGCTNSGTVDACSNIASGASAAMSGARQLYVGGIAGIVVGLKENPAKISGCTNTGAVLAGGISKPCALAGGILGGTAFTEITDCTNAGSFGMTKNTLAPVNAKIGAVGGIVAHILKVTPVPVLSNCKSMVALPAEAVDKCSGEIYATGNKPTIK